MADLLTDLESESICIIREAFRKFKNLAMLWSMGKDSTALLWLARKAFFGHVPFPLLHIDTSYKIPSMIEYRDRIARELNLQLVVWRNEAALADGCTYPNGRATRVECWSRLKEDALQVLRHDRWNAARRGAYARKGALLLAAGIEYGMERRLSAGRILGPVHIGLRAGNRRPGAPAVALD
jgi:sulfate adenylyltransferase subunit 2